MAGFMKNITLVAQSVNMYRDEVLNSHGITGCQVKYILHVVEQEGVSQDLLAKKLMVNKSNVARQLSALESSGLIRREQSEEDRRVMRVYTTDKGKALVPIVRESNKKWRDALCEGLSEEEVEQLIILMQKLVANARRHLGCEL